jgi:hypothetical protein
VRADPSVRARSLSTGLAAALALLAAPCVARADSTDACLQASDEGQVLRDQGKLIEARARFLTCARESCPRLVRADCGTWLADAESRTPTVVLSAQDPAGHDIAEVKVILDGAPLAERLEARAVPVNPGQHRFRFERPGSPAVEETLILREGEQRRAVAARFHGAGEPSRSPSPSPSPLPPRSAGPTREVVAAAIALGGVAAVGGGLFAYFATTAESAADHLRATCAPNCNPGDVSAIRTREIVANVSLGVGIGAVAAGLGALLFAPREAPAVAPVVARVPGGGVLLVGGRF